MVEVMHAWCCGLDVHKQTVVASVIDPESPITEADLSRVDELFLTGTSIEIMPVVSVDGRSVGGGKAGLLTLSLLDGYQASVQKACC